MLRIYKKEVYLKYLRHREEDIAKKYNLTSTNHSLEGCKNLKGCCSPSFLPSGVFKMGNMLLVKVS